MFLPTTTIRRGVLLVLFALSGALIGLAGAQSAHARTPAAQQTARLAATAHPPGLAYLGYRNSQLYESNLTGSRRHQLTFGESGANLPRWGPFGGKILYVVSGTGLLNFLYLIRADGRHNHLLRAFNSSRQIRDVAWAPGAGRIALVMGDEGSSNTDIFIYTPRANKLTALHLNPTRSINPETVDWSHDGRRIVFSARGLSGDGDPTGDTDLYSLTPDGSDVQQVTNTPGVGEDNPRWSPDDSRLLFGRRAPDASCSSSTPPRTASWIVNAAADGTDEMRLPGACSSGMANWSPNGQRIVIARAQDFGVSRVWTTALDGTAREFIARGFWASYRPPA